MQKYLSKLKYCIYLSNKFIKSEVLNMSKDSNGKPKDLNDVEMLIAPSSPKGHADVHLIANERRQGKEVINSQT